jgi:hypothetical protein
MQSDPIRAPRRLSASQLCSPSVGAALAQERWDASLNPRFGAAADYPADLFT